MKYTVNKYVLLSLFVLWLGKFYCLLYMCRTAILYAVVDYYESEYNCYKNTTSNVNYWVVIWHASATFAMNYITVSYYNYWNTLLINIYC